nr:putative pectinesterase, catalytic [Tanacetum cinerariifolium]
NIVTNSRVTPSWREIVSLTFSEAGVLHKTVNAPVLIALVVKKATISGQDVTPSDHVKHALLVLHKLFGEVMVRDPVASIVTDWGRDPFSYGAYSYVAVGASEVCGFGFIARDITFRNTAGAELGQAVAFLSSPDKSAFYHCSFEGYQDTLYSAMYKQFYKECKIYGTVDFIFGNSLAVFQDCEIFFRIPIGGLVATAQARKYDNEPNGYSLHVENSNLQAFQNANPFVGCVYNLPWCMQGCLEHDLERQYCCKHCIEFRMMMNEIVYNDSKDHIYRMKRHDLYPNHYVDS